ncbi:unnamed protein product [Ectocarpus sp. CCAP 1310/34]|nr:unnamed protein product [Ectocarpus sp. CCAP 1310/34]
MNELIMVAFGVAVIQQLLSSLTTDTPGAVSAEDAADFAESFARSCLLPQPPDQSEALVPWPAVSAGAARAACLVGLSCVAGGMLDKGTLFLFEVGLKTFINLIIIRSLRFLASMFQGPL